MRPLTNETPKSLLPVAGRPILDELLDDLQAWENCTAIHIAINHRDADAFHQWASEWQPVLDASGIELCLHDNGVASPDEKLGALGDLKLLLDKTSPPSDGALVTGGDSLYRFPLAPILDSFQAHENRLLAIYEPDPDRRRHSSTLELEGAAVTGLVDDPADTDSERICPSWYLLTGTALSRVSPYLDAGGAPDTLGRFIDHLTTTQDVSAIRLPPIPALRLHCNTPQDLEKARAVMDEQGQYAIDAETVRACIPPRRQ